MTLLTEPVLSLNLILPDLQILVADFGIGKTKFVSLAQNGGLEMLQLMLVYLLVIFVDNTTLIMVNVLLAIKAST